jgi:DNA invertase Pin-like site-specific DNA recombinase
VPEVLHHDEVPGLAREYPVPVRGAAEQLSEVSRQARDTLVLRDQLVRQMRADGASLRQIAEAAGLSHSAIARILAR